MDPGNYEDRSQDTLDIPQMSTMITRVGVTTISDKAMITISERGTF